MNKIQGKSEINFNMKPNRHELTARSPHRPPAEHQFYGKTFSFIIQQFQLRDFTLKFRILPFVYPVKPSFVSHFSPESTKTKSSTFHRNSSVSRSVRTRQPTQDSSIAAETLYTVCHVWMDAEEISVTQTGSWTAVCRCVATKIPRMFTEQL